MAPRRFEKRLQAFSHSPASHGSGFAESRRDWAALEVGPKALSPKRTISMGMWGTNEIRPGRSEVTFNY